jgi:hypothetical protein
MKAPSIAYKKINDRLVKSLFKNLITLTQILMAHRHNPPVRRANTQNGFSTIQRRRRVLPFVLPPIRHYFPYSDTTNTKSLLSKYFRKKGVCAKTSPLLSVFGDNNNPHYFLIV